MAVNTNPLRYLNRFEFGFVILLQIPDWSKCPSRKDRKEKKVEKPFYSDSEGESGPTESADSGNHGDSNIISLINQTLNKQIVYFG